MRYLTISGAALLLSAGAAWACPDPAMSGAPNVLDAGMLSSGQVFVTEAGGENMLMACNLGDLGFGQFRSAPDFTVDLGAVSGQPVTFSVSSTCDPALLVNTQSGEWLFNDDTNGLDPAITIPSAAGGPVQVWVGTFAGDGCPAELTVQTGMGDMAQAVPAPVPVPTPAPAPAPVPVPVPATPANCPNPALIGPSLTLTGAQLMTPQGYVANVTGGQDLNSCNINTFATGSASQTPQFTLNMSGMSGMTFVAELDTPCDPTLLIHDAFGQYHFNDDSNGLNSRLEIDGSSLNGQVSVWVGTWSGEQCTGTITFSAMASGMTGGGIPGAGGCPNPGLTGVPVSFTGQQLYSPQTLATTAGGNAQVSTCGVGGFGYTSEAPNFSVNLTGMEGYGRLEIEGVSGCDTTLLVRTPDGRFHYDDDSNGNLLPLLNLSSSAMLNGRLDIWVGTFGGNTCPASIELETWLN